MILNRLGRIVLPICITGILCVLLSLINSSTPTHAAGKGAWVNASPPRSCGEICSEEGLFSVTSGKDGGGYSFHVCRGQASNGELRPGFNIETSSDSARLCLFEYGGGRGQSGNYDCLCLPDRL